MPRAKWEELPANDRAQVIDDLKESARWVSRAKSESWQRYARTLRAAIAALTARKPRKTRRRK